MSENRATDSSEDTPPDAVACWQKLASVYGNVDASGTRGCVCIGIVDVLSVCESLAFWHTLFVNLGFSVRVPKHDFAGINSRDAAGAESIPSESVCYPAKLSHIYAADVVCAGASVVFMPKFSRHARCPVSCEYSNALKFNMYDGAGEMAGAAFVDGAGLAVDTSAGQGSNVSSTKNKVRMLCPNLMLRKPIHMLKIPDEAENLRASINDIINALNRTDAQVELTTLGMPVVLDNSDAPLISAEEFTRALESAAQAQRAFNDAVSAENERAYVWAQEPGHHGILLVGRPYHWNRCLLHDVNYLLVNLGFSVLTYHPRLTKKKKREVPPEVLLFGGAGDKDATTNSAIPRAMINLEELQNVGDVAPAVDYWRASKHMTRLCEEACADDFLDVVCLQSFGCGYDAASVPEARAVVRCSGKPFTLLMIDDVVNTSHVRVRLRTLAAAIRQRRMLSARRAQGVQIENACDSETPCCNLVTQTPSSTRSFTCACAPSGNYVPLPISIINAAKNQDICAFSSLNAQDYEAARSCAENYCYLVALLVGRACRICAQCAGLQTIKVPYVCYACLLDALPATLERALGRKVNVIWERNWHAFDSIDSPDANVNKTDKPSSNSQQAKAAASKIKIGIIGAPPLVFDTSINDNLAHTIKENGCEPVFPEVPLILEDDISFSEQLSLFYNEGVRDVLYLMSFGCLKGHVQVRAKMPLFKKRYPNMRITIIDFDGDASSLNRTNRLLLAIACAKELRKYDEN